MVITGDFNLNYLHITFRSLISLKTVKKSRKDQCNMKLIFTENLLTSLS